MWRVFISLLLGNDLVGDKVIMNPIVSQEPSNNTMWQAYIIHTGNILMHKLGSQKYSM